MSAFEWTYRAEDELRRLWAEGVSYTSCASALSIAFGTVVSRCAVGGKVKRLGLPCRRSTPNGNTKPRSRIALRRKHRLNVFGLVKLDIEDKPAAQSSVLSASEIPIHQRKKLLQLNPGDCRWPYGDVGTPDFFFCGGEAERKSPYCAFHNAIAFARPRNQSDESNLRRRLAMFKRRNLDIREQAAE